MGCPCPQCPAQLGPRPAPPGSDGQGSGPWVGADAGNHHLLVPTAGTQAYHSAGCRSTVSRCLSRAPAKAFPTGKPWRASSMLGWKRRAQGSRPCRWCASS